MSIPEENIMSLIQNLLLEGNVSGQPSDLLGSFKLSDDDDEAHQTDKTSTSYTHLHQQQHYPSSQNIDHQLNRLNRHSSFHNQSSLNSHNNCEGDKSDETSMMLKTTSSTPSVITSVQPLTTSNRIINSSTRLDASHQSSFIDGSLSCLSFLKPSYGTTTPSTDEITKNIGSIFSHRNSLAHSWDVNDLLGPSPIGNSSNISLNNQNGSGSSNNHCNSINSANNAINSRGFHGTNIYRTDGSLKAANGPDKLNNCSIDYQCNTGSSNTSSSSSSSLLLRKGLSESKFTCDGLWSTNDLLSPLSDCSYNSLLSTSTSFSKGLEPCINTTSSSTAACFETTPLTNVHNIASQRNDLASSITTTNHNCINSGIKSSYLFPPLVKGNGNCLYDIEPGTSICHNNNNNAVNINSLSRRGTVSSHYTSSSSSSSLVDSPRGQEDEFESQMARIASEIHSTIQLHMSGLQIRRDQLLQQLDNVKRVYSQLFKNQHQHQQQSSPSSSSTGSSCSIGGHLSDGNGLGGGGIGSNNGNNNTGNGNNIGSHRRIGYVNQSRICCEVAPDIPHPLPLPAITFTKPDSALLKAVSSLGFLTTPAFAPCCSATGDGLEVAVPGSNNNFTIVTRNCFNEDLLIGRENIIIKIVPISSSPSSTTQPSANCTPSPPSPSSSNSPPPLLCNSIYSPKRSGTSEIIPANGGESGINGGSGPKKNDGLHGIDGGNGVGSLHLSPFIQHHNSQSISANSSSKLTIPYTLLDHNNGKYTVTYLLPSSRSLPNELNITILVNSIPLNDSPFHVPVQLEQRSKWRLALTFGSEGNAIGQLCRPWGVAIVRMPPSMLNSQYMVSNNNSTNGGGGNCNNTNNNDGDSVSSSISSSCSSSNHQQQHNHYCNSTSTGNSYSSTNLTGIQVSANSQNATTTGMFVAGGGRQQQQSQNQGNQLHQHGSDKIPQSTSGHQYFSSLLSSNSSSSLHNPPSSLQGTNTHQHGCSSSNVGRNSTTTTNTGNAYTSYLSSDHHCNGPASVGINLSTGNTTTGIESCTCSSSSSSTGHGPNNNRNGSKSTTTDNNSSNNNIANNNKHYLIAIADRSNNRIQLLHFDAGALSIKVLHVFGSGPGTRAGLFDRPAGITINTSLNHIIVADKDNHRIQVFDLSGRYQFKFGEKGNRVGQFCYPWDVDSCPHTHQLLVSDTRNRRVQLFTPYGQYITHFAHPLDSPRGVSFLGDNRIVVSDFNKHRLLIFDKFPSKEDASKVIGFGEGTGWGEFLRPQGISILCNSIFCADSRNNRICIYNLFTQSFEYLGQDLNCDRPSGLHVIDNILVIVDFGNNRLQICLR